MKPRRKRKLSYDLMRFKTYKALKAFTMKHRGEFAPEENWAIMERMRQLYFGYKPGELKMVKTMRFLTMEEFREESEREYAEQVKKYGPP
jgi:hypothetical protein